ncbi:carbonic anhydrase family protein [Duganella sp. FT92W]|uniref:carbonic anhydrase n=1 Tax=Pseudoduganella rivuli TaxID=2666085 RepID=A0A7X2LW21_9BURK|nr:carbonic anhydrase family protein [Pseudoduganella rivuli]MRV74474.1 carbonic anhydrase family protein [Pseudoduganella rivuli]
MRNLIVLIACWCTAHVLSVAHAADSAYASPSVSRFKSNIESIRPMSPMQVGGGGSSRSGSKAEDKAGDKKSGGKPRPLTEREKEEQAEAELQARIAEKLATMKAQQAARAAAAAKARKEADARAKALALMPPPRANGTHWGYEGEIGPANWHKINSDWIKCSTGNRQSPIDIRDGMKVELEQIVFDYHPSAFNVQDNGHTVQVTMGGGNFITVGNRAYELVQFHFHRPSEERINGKGYEMVVHLVHKDGEGRYAVLALLLERGKPQPAIQTVWNNLPLEKGDVSAPAIVLDPNDLLPQRRDYFTYMGSLTTPPCTENVLWLVMKEPVQASPAQMALFSRLYPLNSRPIQPTSGRMIKESM